MTPNSNSVSWTEVFQGLYNSIQTAVFNSFGSSPKKPPRFSASPVHYKDLADEENTDQKVIDVNYESKEELSYHRAIASNVDHQELFNSKEIIAYPIILIGIIFLCYLLIVPLKRLLERVLSLRSYSKLATKTDEAVTKGDETITKDDESSPKLTIYCFGGMTQSNKNTNAVSKLTFTTKDWSTGPEMSTPRRKFGGAMIDKKIYVCGGYGEQMLSTMEVFDFDTGSWSQLKEMPEGRTECSAAALNGYVYVTGGRVDGNRNGTDTALRYDIANDRWENIESMNQSRQDHQLVELAGRLYAICGWRTNTVEEYDPTSGGWRYVAEATFEHKWAGATAHEEKIYVCSEYGFEVYHPEADKWEMLPSLDRCKGRTLVSVGDKIWALGGIGSGRIFEYDPRAREWSRLGDMDMARSHHCSFVVTK